MFPNKQACKEKTEWTQSLESPEYDTSECHSDTMIG